MTESQAIDNGGDIVANPSGWYRAKMLLMGLLIFGYMGGYFLYDGFVGYPKQNAKYDELSAQIDRTADPAEKTRLVEEQKKLGNKHTETDLMLQRGIGIVGIPLGLFMIGRALYVSRGKYRLSGDTVYVPGHPPVTFDMIRDIDKSKWDKKGIALVSYSASAGKVGTFKLDDYIYDRDATDAILERIENAISPAAEQ